MTRTRPNTPAQDIRELQRDLARDGHYTGAIDGVFGPLTLSAQIESHGAPAWLLIAAAELGVSEIVGRRHNPRIQAYHATTNVGDVAPDEIPWCSSFVNWVMLRAGERSTRSAAARSWLRWGMPLAIPAVGAIAILERGAPPSGHVGFLIHWTPSRIFLLGGNQTNSVRVSPYDRSLLLDLRYPRP